MSERSAPQVDWISQYDALTLRAGMVDLGQRTQIELSGPDRASFLHNLSTNEIRKLPSGSGCEAFLTSVQGKTLAHGFVFAGPETLVFETVAGESAQILKHLDHYLVCEKVTLADRTPEWSELYLAGPEAEAIVQQLSAVLPGKTRLANAQTTLADRSAWLRRADLTGPTGFLISALVADVPTIQAALLAGGAELCQQPAFEAARIEAGFPLFGRDISDNNLPQEVARDALAISFVKGCYLGQETVARIDALGHVNKTLAALQFDGDRIATPGLELTAAGQTVGQVTSATYSPRLAAPLALAYLRRGSNTPESRVESDLGPAEVIALPVR